jgi:hypothetical protein
MNRFKSHSFTISGFKSKSDETIENDLTKTALIISGGAAARQAWKKRQPVKPGKSGRRRMTHEKRRQRLLWEPQAWLELLKPGKSGSRRRRAQIMK